MRVIRTAQRKLILYFGKDGRIPSDGSRHDLFDLKNDAEELNNLYGRQSVARTQQELEEQLWAWMRKAGVTKE